MAQRFPDAKVIAIDIVPETVVQARDNVEASPFVSRITVLEKDINNFLVDSDRHFDAIVSNPPYYIDALTCPDKQRTTARHTESMTYEILMQRSSELLGNNGELSVIVPTECRLQMEQAAAMSGLILSRLCAVKTTASKPPRRYLLAFRKQLVCIVQYAEMVIGDQEYNKLLHDYYLKM